MLDMGFIPDIERIVQADARSRARRCSSRRPCRRRSPRLTEQFLHNPVRIEVARAGHHRRRPSPSAWSPPARQDHEQARDAARADPRRGRRQERHHLLQPQARRRDCCTSRCSSHGFDAAALHGDMDQRARMAALDALPHRRDRRCWWPATSPPAASTSRPSATSSTSTCRTMPRTTSTASAAPAAPAAPAHAFTLVTPRRRASSLAAIEKLIGQPIAWSTATSAPLAEPSGRCRGDAAPRPHRGRAATARAPRGGAAAAPARPQPEATARASASAPRRAERRARPRPPRRPSARQAPTAREARRAGRAGRRPQRDAAHPRRAAPARARDRSRERVAATARPRAPRRRGRRHAGRARRSCAGLPAASGRWSKTAK